MAQLTPAQTTAELKRKASAYTSGNKTSVPTNSANQAQFNKIVESAAPTKPVSAPVEQPPIGAIPVRDAISSSGNVGYNPSTKMATLNGQDLNIPNTQNIKGSLYAQPSDIATASGTGGSVRSSLSGMGQVGYNLNTKLPTFNGQDLNIEGTTNIGGTNYAPVESIANSLQSKLTTQPTFKQQEYTSPYAEEIKSSMEQLKNPEPFSYDSDTDQAFQQASKKLTNQIMESMNARGILGSTITGYNVSEGVANMLPQYQNAAYSRYQDQQSRVQNYVNTLLKMDETSYSQYKDQVTQDYQRYKDEYQKKVDQINLLRDRVTSAQNRLKDLGYADNQVASVLAIAPGTLSSEARQAVAEAKAKVDAAAQKAKDDLAAQDKEFEMKVKTFDAIENNPNTLKNKREAAESASLVNQRNASAAKSRADVASGGTSGGVLKPAVLNNNYNEAISTFSNMSNDEMYNYLTKGKKDIVAQVGSSNYNKLIQTNQNNYYNSLLMIWRDSSPTSILASINAKPDYYKAKIGIANFNKLYTDTKKSAAE